MTNTDWKYASKTMEWYTPRYILDLVVEILGSIDLDPCSNPEKTVPATTHYCLPEQDGLILPWKGTVFLNPPYGKYVSDWIVKFSQEQKKELGNTILLLPARVDTRWYQMIEYNVEMRFKGRVKFEPADPTQKRNPAGFPSVLLYWGDQAGKERFIEKTEKYGKIVLPYRKGEAVC